MSEQMPNNPALQAVKEAFPQSRLRVTRFRGQNSLIVEPRDSHSILRFLRDDPRTDYNFLSDVFGVDYLNYPAEMPGRFAVVYNLISFSRDDRLFVKVFVSPTLPTAGTVDDPGLHVDSACDIWPGAEWNERETFDMFGVRFDNHPDLRRILLWEDYPGFPLRKDYPLRGRGEREQYRIVDRTTS